MNLPLNIDIQQIFLHMLNFVLLFAGLYFILYKPVKEFIDKRKKLYEDMDIKANSSLTDAENIKKEYEEKLAVCDEEVKRIKSTAVADAEKEAKNILEAAQNDASDIIEKAKILAENEKEKTVKAANREISQLAADATKKIMFESTSESFDAFLDNAKEGENLGE